METFTPAKALVANARYADERRAALETLDLAAVDGPVVDIVQAFMSIPHCFTLQCCYGHFLTTFGQDAHSLARLPGGHQGAVRYRVAYVAFCVEPSDRGRAFLDTLSRVPAIDPGYVQFGCADWFWDQWVNSYALQVEPAAHRFKDQAVLTLGEATQTQRARDRFFDELRRVLTQEPAWDGAPEEERRL